MHRGLINGSLRGVWLPYVVAATVFTKSLFGMQISGSIVDVFLLAVATLGLLGIASSRVAVSVGAAWTVLLAISYAVITYLDYPEDILLKQGVPAAFIYTGMAVLIERCGSRAMLVAYFHVSVIAAVFGILQFALSLVGVSVLNKVPGRLNSLAYEPSHYAIGVAPALYLAIRDIVHDRRYYAWGSWAIITSVMLTVSVTGLFILATCSLVIFLRARALLGFAVLLVVFYTFFSNPELMPDLIRERFEASADVVAEGVDVQDVKNASVFSPLSNWEVAVHNLQLGRLLGCGIGGHPTAYFEYFNYTEVADHRLVGLNVIAGHSLFIRVVSELGLLGGGLYLLYLLWGLRCGMRDQGIWWTLLAIYLAGRIVKLGGFFEVGMPIFVVAPFAFYGAGWRYKLAFLPLAKYEAPANELSLSIRSLKNGGR